MRSDLCRIELNQLPEEMSLAVPIIGSDYTRGVVEYLTAWGAVMPAGVWTNVLPRCPIRISTTKCGGQLKLLRSEAPSTITIRCHKCGGRLVISSWENTRADIRKAFAVRPVANRDTPNGVSLFFTKGEIYALAASCQPNQPALLPLWAITVSASWGYGFFHEHEPAAMAELLAPLVARETDGRRRMMLRGLQAKLANVRQAQSIRRTERADWEESRKAESAPWRPLADRYDGLGFDGFYMLMRLMELPPKLISIPDNAVLLRTLRETPVMNQARLFLQAVEDAGGAPATQKNNLGREFCQLLAPTFEGAELLGLRAFDSEWECSNIRRMRLLLQKAGYLSCRKKRFVATRSGREFLLEPSADNYTRLFNTYVFMDWYAYEVRMHHPFMQQTLWFSIYLLQRYGDTPRIAYYYADRYLSAVEEWIRDRQPRDEKEDNWRIIRQRSGYQRVVLDDCFEWFGLVKYADSVSHRQSRSPLQRTRLFEQIMLPVAGEKWRELGEKFRRLTSEKIPQN